ncbi:hypothetical protein KDA_33650 [Dictyobacter alpinus]|uniref:Uncharacterized protein n=1 Tax=Dictyobacter alpinus TaxID=2014873 RepID=A0A402B928_9CHLR|nr:hypothetical protein [Dictyobacter alpinus]GCE27881.1 hypothetical protein KDA_33650 [Dictyobacter alpinus]
MSEKLLARLVLDLVVKQYMTDVCPGRKNQEVSTEKLLALAFGEMLLDPESGKFLIFTNELLSHLPPGIET